MKTEGKWLLFSHKNFDFGHIAIRSQVIIQNKSMKRSKYRHKKYTSLRLRIEKDKHMKTVWIATGNPHKTEEFAKMLGENVQIKTLKDLDQEPIIVEDGTTFEENALIKARALHQIVHEAVMADDSGLEVDALDKAPGIYSARFMGEDTSYTIKNQAILDAIKDKTGDERSARFACAIAWIEADGTEHVYRDRKSVV